MVSQKAIATWVISFASAAGLAAVQGVPQTTPSNVTSSISRATGDYTFTFVDRGQSKNVSVTPATQVKPTVSTTVGYDSADRRYTYTYTVGNGQGARQELYSFGLNVQFPVEVRGSPVGWLQMLTPETRRIRWYFEGGRPQREGILPGASVTGFSIVSAYLPAPQQVRFAGNAPTVQLPADLPDDVRLEIERVILSRNYVTEWAMAPTMPNGDGEPELTPAVFVARIHTLYGRALGLSTHPNRVALLEGLKNALGMLQKEPTRDHARSLRELTVTAAGTDWDRALGSGLNMALVAMKARFGLQ